MTLTQQIEKLENRLAELKTIDREKMNRDQKLIFIGRIEEIKHQIDQLKTDRENAFWSVPSGTKITSI